MEVELFQAEFQPLQCRALVIPSNLWDEGIVYYNTCSFSVEVTPTHRPDGGSWGCLQTARFPASPCRPCVSSSPTPAHGNQTCSQSSQSHRKLEEAFQRETFYASHNSFCNSCGFIFCVCSVSLWAVGSEIAPTPHHHHLLSYRNLLFWSAR